MTWTSPPITISFSDKYEAAWSMVRNLESEQRASNRGGILIPNLKFWVSGLNPLTEYTFSLHWEPTTTDSLVFCDGSWNLRNPTLGYGKYKTQNRKVNRCVARERVAEVWHPKGFLPGKDWMSNGIGFEELKLVSGKRKDLKEMEIYLPTSYEYVPNVSIYAVEPNASSVKLVEIIPLDSCKIIAVANFRKEGIKECRQKIMKMMRHDDFVLDVPVLPSQPFLNQQMSAQVLSNSSSTSFHGNREWVLHDTQMDWCSFRYCSSYTPPAVNDFDFSQTQFNCYQSCRLLNQQPTTPHLPNVNENLASPFMAHPNTCSQFNSLPNLQSNSEQTPFFPYAHDNNLPYMHG